MTRRGDGRRLPSHPAAAAATMSVDQTRRVSRSSWNGPCCGHSHDRCPAAGGQRRRPRIRLVPWAAHIPRLRMPVPTRLRAALATAVPVPCFGVWQAGIHEHSANPRTASRQKNRSNQRSQSAKWRRSPLQIVISLRRDHLPPCSRRPMRQQGVCNIRSSCFAADRDGADALSPPRRAPPPLFGARMPLCAKFS